MGPQMLKVNIAYPTQGSIINTKVESLAAQRFNGLKILDTFDGELINPEWKGHKFQITGGCDKDGFPMVQNIYTDKRIRPLLKMGMTGFRCRKKGLRKRKSVRGCVVSEQTGLLNVKLVETGQNPIPGLTDVTVPCSHWPRRYTKLIKRLGLEDGVTPEEIKNKIKEMVKEQSNGEKVRYPKIKIHRYKTEKQVELKERRKKESALKKEKSIKAMEEFEKKYPNWGKINLH